MEIVVDTSVLIAVIANEPSKASLIAVTQEADLIAPASVIWEIGNAFSAMFKRKAIHLSQALKALEIFRKIPVRWVDVELSEAVQIAADLNIYAYDAYLLRCALKYKAPLLSLDDKLLRLAKANRIAVVEVAS